MRFSLRNQILVPFLVLVVLTISALAGIAAVLSARHSEQQSLQRLLAVVETLEQTTVPYTTTILQKMKGLSGAEFVARSGDGLLVATTLATDIIPRSLPETPDLASHTRPLREFPVVKLGNTSYFVVSLSPARVPGVRRLWVLSPEEAWAATRREAALPPLLVGAAAILLTVVVSGWLSQRLGSRVRRLQDQVAAIAAGDFQEIPAGPLNDELTDLAGSVNTLSGRLRDLQQAIRVSERHTLLAQVAGGLAHQLRNAVTGARLALQLHQRRCAHGPEDHSLNVALRQLELMETQLKGLLSLGKREVVPRRNCTLAELLAEVVPLVRAGCEHSRISLVEGPVPETAAFALDVEGVRAAVLNLMLNGMEAAGPGGEVEIAAGSDESHAWIDVLDNGPGPAAEFGETLFEPFVTSKPEGVGLGLALARQVAAEHGGELTWRRTADRTCFRLEFPRK